MDIFDAVEDSTSKPKASNKRKLFKRNKKSDIFEPDIPNPFEDCIDNLSPVEQPTDEKSNRKGKWFKNKDETQEPSETPTSRKPNSTWTVVTKEHLIENETHVEVEDVVDTHERTIGKRLKTELDINEARNLDLSLKDRIELTLKYVNKEQEEAKKLEEYRAEEEKRANHVITLRNYVLTELSIHLTDVNQELVMSIDAKFGPYIEEAMREVELGYYVKEIPRNADLVNLNPNLPYKYSFMVRAI